MVEKGRAEDGDGGEEEMKRFATEVEAFCFILHRTRKRDEGHHSPGLEACKPVAVAVGASSARSPQTAKERASKESALLAHGPWPMGCFGPPEDIHGVSIQVPHTSKLSCPAAGTTAHRIRTHHTFRTQPSGLPVCQTARLPDCHRPSAHGTHSATAGIRHSQARRARLIPERTEPLH
ncbi:hypothetical protein BCR34DRAFT_385609 [Clohesyomyces aquaticus]|uniref:Uncharacterized protein n=1 Tax=Clohesyomyces aquaticus TaxID=1231657 RepID=A0A1Y1ZFJ0_9PLEO|nr:hypothetical protein BCR34DRAFT_385609 [Clohesyomyces aquaticus]